MKKILYLGLLILVFGYGQPPGGGIGDHRKARMKKKMETHWILGPEWKAKWEVFRPGECFSKGDESNPQKK